MEQDQVNETTRQITATLNYILNQTNVDSDKRTPEGIAELLRVLVEIGLGSFIGLS